MATHARSGEPDARIAETDGMPDGASPMFRSGAVARMALIPVATLRTWEQRYRAVRPTTTPSGHRLYGSDDVQRVMLLRQLTHQGHAIGSIAALETARLRDLLEQPGRAETGAGVGVEGGGPTARTGELRLVVVGKALAARLERVEIARRLQHPLAVQAVFETLDAAIDGATRIGADLLVCQSPNLQDLAPQRLEAARSAWRARKSAVLYRFAGAAVRTAVAGTGALVFREPQDDESLGVWLSFLQSSSGVMHPSVAPVMPTPDVASRTASRPRRFDDATLTAVAGLVSSSACECPRHVAELLMQIGSFEAYTADCIERHPADAELHADLLRVAEASRSLFEAALEQVARHEGWTVG